MLNAPRSFYDLWILIVEELQDIRREDSCLVDRRLLRCTVHRGRERQRRGDNYVEPAMAALGEVIRPLQPLAEKEAEHAGRTSLQGGMNAMSKIL